MLYGRFLISENIDSGCGQNFQKDVTWTSEFCRLMCAWACSQHVQSWIQSHIYSACPSFSSTAAWPALSFLCLGTMSGTSNSMWWILSQLTHALPHCWSHCNPKTLNVLINNLLFLCISDKKPGREGRLAPGGIWTVKHKMESFYGVCLWKVLACGAGT